MGFIQNSFSKRSIDTAEQIQLDGKTASVTLKVPLTASACKYGFGDVADTTLDPGDSITIQASNSVKDTGVLDDQSIKVDWDAAATTKLVVVLFTKFGKCIDA